MCAPGVSAVAGLAMGVMQAGAQYQASQADFAAKSAAWRQNIVNSEAAARDEYGQIIDNQLVQQNKTFQQEQLSSLQQAQKQASVATAAIQGGVSGISVDNILQDIANKSEQQRSYAAENYKYVVADTTAKLTSATDQEQSHINSVAVPQPPSELAAMAQIGTAGVKAFSALSPGMSMGDA